MFTDPFSKASLKETEEILQKLEVIAPKETFTAQGVSCLYKSLEFYPQARYYDITQADQHPARQCLVIDTPAATHLLNGNTESLYTFNEKIKIALSSELIEDYARFFIAHYRGSEGRTILIETVDDPIWLEDPTPSSRKLLSERITPLKITGTRKDGGWQLAVTLLIRNHMYEAQMEISPVGRVTFEQVETVAENLPVADLMMDA